MKLNEKKETINEINSLANSSTLIAILDFSNVTSLELKNIRKNFFGTDVKIKVVKNTLVKKSLKNTKNKFLSNYIYGQNLIIFSENNIKEPIDFIYKFQKNKKLNIKNICINGKLFPVENINELVELPDRKELLMQLISSFRLPFIEVIKRLNYYQSKFVILLKLIKKGVKNDNKEE